MFHSYINEFTPLATPLGKFSPGIQLYTEGKKNLLHRSKYLSVTVNIILEPSSLTEQAEKRVRKYISSHKGDGKYGGVLGDYKATSLL